MFQHKKITMDALKTESKWYAVDNIDEIDSPALLVYLDSVKENIRLVKTMVKRVDTLRPHVKTNKMSEACGLMLAEGINKFKCATIAEAEMLAMIKAPDVLLAYQPTGPKVSRFLQLINKYPETVFSCLIDNKTSAGLINKEAFLNNININVFIDINVGMNRTGISPLNAFDLIAYLNALPNLNITGLHAYDGHIKDKDLIARKQNADIVFNQVYSLKCHAKKDLNVSLKIVIGGSPTFPIHATRENVECSPGTFIFWDWGYKHSFPEQPFNYAALVITRVVSIIDAQFICTDLGYKSISSESPLPRVHFLNAPEAVPFGHSEEHLVLQVPDASNYKIGDVLYGVPVHVCPTVALYETANVVDKKNVATSWKVMARNRFIHI